MYEQKMIVVVVVLSGVVAMLFLLFSVTPATITNIHQQEASALLHEKFFGGSRNSDAQLTTDIKPTNTATTTATSKQTGTPDDDDMRGSDQNDVIVGLAGNDII